MNITSDPVLATPSASAHQGNNSRPVGLWLMACAAMVFAMAVIGAITRLTESGLSIMEWAPVTGALPPLSEAEWQRLFTLYRQIPEYLEENAGMSLAEFKTIFWWEYIHRLWGRLIGVVFALPFLWFWWRGRLGRPLVPHLVALFALGGLQGLMGWYMVASGFAGRTDVSQYRLAAHLALAVLIYGYLLKVAFAQLCPRPGTSTDPRAAALRRALGGLLALTALTIVSGAFVAGLNAGFTYNSFPLMDGDLVPAGYGDLRPWVLNLFENVAAVQFNHRLLAMVTVAMAAGLWLWSRRLALSPGAARALALLFASALLLAVPVWLGALHQGGALLLLGFGLWARHQLRHAFPPPAQGL